MRNYPNHTESMVSLKRIEGQVRGVQRMIEKREYCVDILNQIHAVIYALAKVEDKILDRHFAHCVTKAFQGKSETDKKAKLKEVINLIHQFRKL